MFAFEKVNKYTSEYSELSKSINRHCSLFSSNILIFPYTSSVSNYRQSIFRMGSLSFMDWVSSVKGTPAHAAGSSPLERLPTEILNRILLYVATPTARKGWDIPHALPGQ